MASITTTLLKVHNKIPGFHTGSLHFCYFLLAQATGLIPKYGLISYKFLMDVGEQISKDSDVRNEKQIKRIIRYEAQDAKMAALSADAAAQIAEYEKSTNESLGKRAKTEAQSKIDHAVSQKKIKAEIGTMQEQGNQELRITEAGASQAIQRTQQDTKFKLTEQKNDHRTKMFSRLEDHLKAMTDLQNTSSEAVVGATTAAKDNTAAIKKNRKSITGLTTAMNENIAAYHKLETAIGNLNRMVCAGEENIKKEQEISQALLATMQAEIKLDTSIATTQIQHKSNLQQALKADVADKNKQLDSFLTKCAQKTLTKLSDLIKNDIKNEQTKIKTLHELKDIGVCQAHLNKLSTMLNSVNQIQEARQDQDPTSDQSAQNTM